MIRVNPAPTLPSEFTILLWSFQYDLSTTLSLLSFEVGLPSLISGLRHPVQAAAGGDEWQAAGRVRGHWLESGSEQAEHQLLDLVLHLHLPDGQCLRGRQLRHQRQRKHILPGQPGRALSRSRLRLHPLHR